MIQPTTAFVPSYIGVTVRRVIRAIKSPSAANLLTVGAGINETKSALKANTMNANNRVVAVEKASEQNPVNNRLQNMRSHQR